MVARYFNRRISATSRGVDVPCECTVMVYISMGLDFKANRNTNAKKVNHECLRDDRPSHGRSLASDPHGCGECHYDVGNIIDHAIAAFVSPFTSDGMFEHPRMDLLRVVERMPWQAWIDEFELTPRFLTLEQTDHRLKIL
jgi:hypothetical protein